MTDLLRSQTIQAIKRGVSFPDGSLWLMRLANQTGNQTLYRSHAIYRV